MASPVSLSPGVSLRLRLVAAAATANPRFTAFYADTSPEGVNTNQGQLNGSTPVVVVEAPSAGSRIVSNLIVQNRDTAALTLIQETFDGTTAAEVFRVQLQVGDFLSGGNVYDQYGSLKSGTTGPRGIQGDEGEPGADGANGVDGITPGLAYNWSTATTATPSSGQLRGNNATYSSITSLFVHESDRNGTDVSAVLSQIAAGTVIQLQSGTNPAKYAWFTVTSNTDNGGDRTIAVAYLASVGTFSDAEHVSLALFRKGSDGTGNVNSVNNVAPVSGNVTLTASSVGAEDRLLAENAQTGTAYTLVLTDQWVTMNNPSASTLTIPTNASVAFPVGTKILVSQLGAGQLSFAPASGVTILNTKRKVLEQLGSITLIKRAADVWLLVGALTT